MIGSIKGSIRLLGDLEGFLLGQTDGLLVGTSAGVLVGNPRNTPTNAATEGDLNLGTSPFDCFAFQMHEITFYGLSLWCSKLIELKGFSLDNPCCNWINRIFEKANVKGLTLAAVGMRTLYNI